jgi:hypothetical protein
MRLIYHRLIFLFIAIGFMSLWTFSCSDDGGLESRDHASKKDKGDGDDDDDDDDNDVTPEIETNGGEIDSRGIDDGKPPPSVEDFAGEATEEALTIALTWKWPADVTDVAKFVIVRTQDNDAPVDCTEGDEVLSSTDTTLEGFEDKVKDAELYSYRICSFDAQGNEDLGNNTARKISAKPDCGGKQVGGHCWYKGEHKAPANTLLCSDTCADHGGFDLKATQDFVGNAGTTENCKEVLDALELGTNGTAVTENAGAIYNKLGCFLIVNQTKRYRGTNATEKTVDDSGHKATNIVRACACKE